MCAKWEEDIYLIETNKGKKARVTKDHLHTVYIKGKKINLTTEEIIKILNANKEKIYLPKIEVEEIIKKYNIKIEDIILFKIINTLIKNRVNKKPKLKEVVYKKPKYEYLDRNYKIETDEYPKEYGRGHIRSLPNYLFTLKSTGNNELNKNNDKIAPNTLSLYHSKEYRRVQARTGKLNNYNKLNRIKINALHINRLKQYYPILKIIISTLSLYHSKEYRRVQVSTGQQNTDELTNKINSEYINKIEKIGVGNARCIKVKDKESNYLCGDGISTHNTYMSVQSAVDLIGMGGRVFALDAKNDFKRIKNVVNVKTLDIEDAHEGSLNPFTFLPEVSAASLISLIEILTGGMSKEELVSVTPIVKDFITRLKRDNRYVDLKDLADYLYSRRDENARSVGNSLMMLEGSRYGKLMFTRKENVKPLKIETNESLVITLLGLNFPDAKKRVENYTVEERITSAIIYLITSKLSGILKEDSIAPTTIFCDEAHLLFSSNELTNLIDKFMVEGGSLNVALVLISQSLEHFPSNIATFLSSKFMFRSSKEEAEQFLDKFSIGDSSHLNVEHIVNGIADLEVGQCFMIDRKNRSGFIKVLKRYDGISSNPMEKTR